MSARALREPGPGTFPRGTPAAAAAKPAAGIAFGQRTIAGVAGWGFEPDLRGDPSDPNRIYMSSPDSAGSNTSWIWRSLDGGKTFKWIPAAAPLNGKITVCPGWGDTELLTRTGAMVDVLTGRRVEGGRVRLADLLDTYPVALLAPADVIEGNAS